MSGAAFKRSVDVFISGGLSPAARSAQLARAAEEGTKGLIQAGRASRRYVRQVDGKEGAPASSVRPDGIIVDRFSYLGEAAAFALAFLQARAPKGSGTYRTSFYLGLSPSIGGDGKFVMAAQFNPDAVTTDIEEIVIGNIQPYSRKVDVQLIGTRALRFSVPAGLFEDTRGAVRRRFGNFADARRVYTRNFPGQYMLRGGKRPGKPVESPALVISLRR
jgi:hypothetical protein